MNSNTEIISLKNGIKGLFINMPNSSAAHIEFNFRAGYLYSDKNQVPHLLEHIIATFPRETSTELIKYGAYSNAESFHEYVRYFVTFPAEYKKEIFQIMKNALENVDISEDKFDTNLNIIKTELFNNSKNDDRQLFSDSLKYFLPNVCTISEQIESLGHIDLTDVNNYFKATHTTDNLKFIIAGDLSLNDMKYFQEEFNNLKMSSKNQIKRTLLKKKSAMRQSEIDNGAQSIMQLSHSVKEHLSIKEEIALKIMDRMLFMPKIGRFYLKARKRGLIYSVRGNIYNYLVKNFSLWTIVWRCKKESKIETSKLLKSEIEKFTKSEFTEEELDFMKQNLANTERVFRQTVKQMVDFYREPFFISDEVVNFNDYLKIIENISRDDIVSVAKKFVKTNY